MRAAEDLEYISIDSDFFDALLTWDQTGHYEALDLSVSNVDGPADWMTMLLQTKAFQRIPPANIQTIFMRMQRIDHRAGDIVIRQGSEGDYFYVIVSGKCIVRRETPLSKEGITLAELGPGNGFGEEDDEEGDGDNRPNVVDVKRCRKELIEVNRTSSERHVEEQEIGIASRGIQDTIKDWSDDQGDQTFSERDKREQHDTERQPPSRRPDVTKEPS